MKLGTYLLVSAVINVVVIYGCSSFPVAFRQVEKVEEVENITTSMTALEPSEASESLEHIPEINAMWHELKAIVEAPEGSERALEEIEDDFEETSEETVSEEVTEEVIIEDSTIYFDVPLSEELQDHIFEQCEAIGLDPAIVISMIARESMYDADIIGDNGRAFGLMQIHPRWHSDRMTRLGCDDLLNPFQNVTVGIDILRELLGRGKPLEWALMAYNGGAGYANDLAAEGRISKYASDVLDRAEKLVEK